MCCSHTRIRFDSKVDLRRYSPSSLGMTVHLCDDDAPEITRLLERLTLCLGSLSDTRIQNHDC